MKAKRGEIGGVMAKGGAGFRAVLLHGPDEAASRALGDAVGKALPQANRIDLTGTVLKSDPARLADEAATASLFGGASWIRVENVGDESLSAVEALLDLAAAENPVVLLAGNLRKGSKLLAACDGSRHVLTHASYLPEGKEVITLIFDLARTEGLELDRDLAQVIGDACGGDRALAAAELAKFALYLDAAPGRPRALDADTLAALAEGQEAEVGALTDAVLDGETRRVVAESERLAATGVEGITISRAVLRALLPLVRMRAAVDAGSGVDAVIGAERVHFRRTDQLRRQLGRWRAPALNTAVTTLIDAELEVMSPGGPGPLAVSAALPRLSP